MSDLPFYTVRSLCQRYGVVPITLRRWIAAGCFPPPLRIGRRKVLWPVAVIVEHERRAAAAVGLNTSLGTKTSPVEAKT